jgi:hypothetical protein
MRRIRKPWLETNRECCVDDCRRKACMYHRIETSRFNLTLFVCEKHHVAMSRANLNAGSEAGYLDEEEKLGKAHRPTKVAKPHE